MISRRNFVTKLSQAGLALPFLSGLKAQAMTWVAPPADSSHPNHASGPQSSSSNPNFVPVQAPGISKLPYEMDNGVKVFRLTAEPATTYFPDMSDPHGFRRRPIHGWGYNGSIIGPTIEAVEGDRVRIHVTNKLPEPTTVHWHGLHIPIEMDGVSGISQAPIQPGETFTYEFTLEQHGTYFYHPHHMGAKQVGLGMSGFFIIHPKNPEPWQAVDHDYAYFLQIWMIHPGSPIPDTMEMTEFNYFTMNGKAAPDIESMRAKVGEKIRIRVANLSMMSHPIHLHGHSFRVTDWGAGFLPEHQHIKANTMDISSAEVRVFEFEALRKGKWLLHCHFMHHTMNDMHRNPLPGSGGGGHSAMGHDMGGMHTWIEVTA